MHESHEHHKLHEFMMNRLFGIDISKISDYDFDSFLSSEISIKKMNLGEFSSSIVVSDELTALYTIDRQSKKYREQIVYHLASRLADLEISVVEQPEWDDESESLWSSVMNSIDDQTFDGEIINKNEDNENLVEWMKIELINREVKHGQSCK